MARKKSKWIEPERTGYRYEGGSGRVLVFKAEGDEYECDMGSGVTVTVSREGWMKPDRMWCAAIVGPSIEVYSENVASPEAALDSVFKTVDDFVEVLS